MLIYLILLMFVAFLIYLHVSVQYSRAGRLLNKIPGPYHIPILGSIHIFSDKSQEGVWVTLRKISAVYYPVGKAYLFHRPVVNIQCPEDLEAILTSPKSINKDYPYYYFQPYLGNGIFTNKGDTYRTHRKMMIAPAFHFSVFNRMFDVVSKQADDFLNDLKERGDEFDTEIMHLFTDLTLKIIIEIATGLNFRNYDKEYLIQYKEAMEEMGSIIVYKMVRPYIPDFIFNWTSIGKREQKARKIYNDLTNKIIEEKKASLEKSGQNSKSYNGFIENSDIQESDNTHSSEKKTMLDMLLTLERDGLIDDAAIRDEINTIVLAGTDTVRGSLGYFVLMMAENKDAQDKARAEVCALLDSNGGKLDINDLQQLRYLEQCIKETMRLYPVGSQIIRYTTGDVQLKDYVLPAGVNVVCEIFDAHRDPNYWPEPDKFDADRFLPENSKNRHPFSYIPFSAGTRICVGHKLGMLEVKTICAKLLYNYMFEPIDRSCDMKILADLVIQPVNPVHAKFIRIDRKQI